MVYHDPTPAPHVVLTAAKAAVDALNSMGIESCVVGGLACKLYGNNRCANDVDIVALTNDLSQEELKRRLVSKDPRFFTVASKNPTATYRVLWFQTSYEKCKVDLLQPGTMNIPHVATRHIETIDGIPLAPFSLVLILKLQAWSDHRAALKTYLRLKQYTDISDLNRLLPLACSAKLNPRNDSGIPMSLITKTEERVKEYTMSYPESKDHWKKLGFEIAKPTPKPKVHVGGYRNKYYYYR